MKNNLQTLLKSALSIVAVGTFLALASSCTKQDFDTFTTVGFNYSYDVTIPDTTVDANQPLEGDYLTGEIDTKFAEKLKDAKTTADLLSEIKLTRLSVTALDGISNLDYLSSIKVYIKSAKNAEVLLVENTNIPVGAYSIYLETKDVNLKNYAFEDKIQFRTKLTMRPNSEIKDQKLRFEASLIGNAKVSSLK